MRPCILGVVAPSGAGKTTLLERVIPVLRTHGLRVAALKHSHHHVELDQPGKDSFRLRHAGAEATLLASPIGWTLMVDGQDEFATLIDVFTALQRFDLVLVEGLRDATIARLEVYRAALGQAPRFLQDANIIAIAAEGLAEPAPIPVLDLNNPQAVAEFILAYIENTRSVTLNTPP